MFCSQCPRSIVVDSRLCVEQDQVSLTKVAMMMWILKFTSFSMHVGVPFNVLRSPYWHEMVQAISCAPKGYQSLGYEKARTVGLDREKAKINNALGKFTNDWTNYGVCIVSDGWTNVKGRPLINILGVFATGMVFLSAHVYLYRYKTSVKT